MATDPAALEAQAKLGMGGVDAYNAAKGELEAQRKRALEVAMAEAQARGAPAASLAGIESTVTTPYDAQIRTLTAAGARASDALARREGRMADYNAAVEQARGLIGDQVNLAIAPINAEADFKVRLLQQQSAGKVAEIEAQMRLDAARAAAAAARAGGGGGRGGGGGGGGGGGSKGTLNATELATNLAQTAGGNLQRARQTAETAMRQTAEQARQAASYAGQSANYDLRRRMEEEARTGNRVGSNSLAQQEAARQAVSYTGQAANAARNTTPGFYPPNASPFGGVGNFVPPGSRTNANLQGATSALDAAKSAYEQAVAAQQRAVQQQQRAAQDAAGRARQIALQTSPLYGAGQSFFTPQQLDAFAQSPDFAVYDAMVGASGIQRIGAIGERLGLNPIDPSSLGSAPSDPTRWARNDPGRGIGRGGNISEFVGSANDITGMAPEGQEVFRRAMQQAAVELAEQGYKITQADVDTAINSPSGDIYKVGDTAYDVARRRAGGKSYREEADDKIAAAEKAAAQGDADARRHLADVEDANRAAIEQDEADAEAIFQNLTGIPTGAVSGYNSIDLANAAQSPVFADAQTWVVEQLNAGAESLDEVWDVLRESGDFDSRSPANQAIKRILEAIYG